MAKLCPKCNRILQECDFYKDKSRRDGLAGWCKECSSIAVKKRYAEGTYKETRKKWNEANIEKIRDTSRKATRKWSNSDRGKECRRAYQKTKKYREWVREYCKDPEKVEKHRADNAKPEQVKQRREYQASDRYKQIRKLYRQSDEGKQAIASAKHRRRAREKGLVSDLTTRQWRIILFVYNGKCAYCGSDTEIQQEHVVPVSRGGGTTMGNIVPACKKCNMSKKDKTVVEWFFQTPASIA